MQAPATTTFLLNPQLAFDPSSLPVGQLESLRFKASQLVESIDALSRTVEYGNLAALPPWPEILSKYTVLLSQTHSLSAALSGSGGAFTKLAVHPRVPLADAQLDNDLIPLLRNNQTTDVLRAENASVRRLAAHMKTRGSVGVLGPAAAGGSAPARPTGEKKPEYEDVVRECEEIRAAHDARAERAIRAVAMLREKYDWHARVEVEIEEPEELNWDPRFGAGEAHRPLEELETGSEGESEDSDEEMDEDDDEDVEDIILAENTPGTSAAATPAAQ